MTTLRCFRCLRSVEESDAIVSKRTEDGPCVVECARCADASMAADLKLLSRPNGFTHFRAVTR